MKFTAGRFARIFGMVAHMAGNDNIPTAPIRLKLEFSRAADRARVDHVFSPAIKGAVDPNNYVVRRDDTVFNATLARGGMVFLSDKSGEIQALTATYHVHENNAGHANTHRFTETGTTLARLPGFNSARLVITAIVLKEWWTSPPAEHFAAEIDHANGGSIHTFRDALRWKRVTDSTRTGRLQQLCDESIAPEERGNPVQWYATDDAVIADQARILLTYMNQGGLANKKTGGFIAVDFSALDSVGLTRKRLEAIAAGTTGRRDLRQLSP